MNRRLFFILFLIVIPFISADTISINSGGDNQLCITSGDSIESCFFCVPTTCAKLGYNCGTWADGCSKMLNCGTCGSGYTCSSGVCTAVPEEEVPGGGGGEVPETEGIVIVPREINLKMAINTNKKEIIKITNTGDSTKILSVHQSNLDKMVILGNASITVAPGETKELEVIFVASDETGIFTGKIIIDGYDILVTLNIKTVLLLFDSNIVVLNRDYKVSQGSELKTKVTLIPMGDKERLDVTLNYVIKNYAGKVYLTQSETVLVEDEMEFNRNFGTGMLPLGDYIIGLELVYPGGIAPSSAHFEVVQRSLEDVFGLILFLLVVGIVIIAILIILLLIKKRKKKENAE
jgi:hypothetical protein